MLERAQLLERFRALERRWRQRGEREQEFAAKGVEADVLEAHAVFAAIRDLRPRKKQRIAATIDHDLHHIGIVFIRRIGDCLAESGHLHLAVLGERRDHFSDHLRLDERQIGLHVDDDLAAQIARSFRDAIRAGAVSRLCEPDDTAERFHRTRNALVVGRHDNGVNAASVRGAAVDVLDHRPPSDIGKDFSGKTRRIVAGGDDGDGVLL
jgi:hypothetical protein